MGRVVDSRSGWQHSPSAWAHAAVGAAGACSGPAADSPAAGGGHHQDKTKSLFYVNMETYHQCIGNIAVEDALCVHMEVILVRLL